MNTVSTSMSVVSAHPDISLTYPSHDLDAPSLQAPCAELPPAWAALLEPLYGADTVLEVKHITTGGSDRAFYRVRHGGVSHVVCVTPSRSEFHNYVAIGNFMRGQGLPVPRLHSWSDTTGLAVLHDCGTVALQDVVLRHGPSAPETYAAYVRVLDTLGALQRLSAQDCAEMADRPFGAVDLRWETDYFRDNFLGRHLGWDLSADAALTAEFEALAKRVLDEPLFPMHRDFQSQNVFIDDDTIWILDFQGARLGPLPYDLASLLRDPYVSLPPDTEDALLRYYHAHAMPPVQRYAQWEDFRRTYALVSLQRLMQALGAYGFLTLVKGKPWFARWMTPALENLNRAVEEVDGLPRLREVVREARQRSRDSAAG